MTNTANTTNLRNTSGNWITGTVEGLEVQAKAFAEPSDEYGMPQEPRISKLWVRTPTGLVIYEYDRGDVSVDHLNDEGLATVIAAVTAKI
jgi:hypothetical protein